MLGRITITASDETKLEVDAELREVSTADKMNICRLLAHGLLRDDMERNLAALVIMASGADADIHASKAGAEK